MELQISKLICCIFFVSVFNICHGSYSNRVKVLNNALHIRYEHQLQDGTNDFTHTIDTSLFGSIRPINCSLTDDKYCRKWANQGQLRIWKLDSNCEQYQLWTTFNEPLQVTFDLKHIHLYGGNEVDNQTWPLKDRSGRFDSYVSKEYNSIGILEPLWFTHTGFYLLVEEKVPLFLAYDKDSMNLMAKRENPFIRDKITHMNYKICKYDNIKTAFKRAIADSIGKPVAPPDYRMVERPIWSTWAKYKAEINESVVMEYANLILKYGFPNSQFEIDDKWEACYGSHKEDKYRFPNMRDLVERLHSMGFRVTLWVHPFVNVECTEDYNEGVKRNFFVKSSNGTVLMSWWQGKGGYVDFTNPEAVDWYRMRLQKLQDRTGVDSFKFDAGEASWAPQPPVFHVMREDHPDTILKAYIDVAASFGDMVEVRSARQTHHHRVFTRMLDRETHWTGRLGLDTVIPELFHQNVIGYPYVIPDMIGGNVYDIKVISKELFIRWMELYTFMPVLQFSIPPWDLDEDVIKISQKYVELHKQHAPMIYELMKRATREEIMVNAPLWWIDPMDETALTIDSEYLLDNILVAPVLKEGATSRDIYFPKGIWRDETDKNAPHIHGPTWVKNYPAPLDVLPHFTKITASSSSMLSPTVLVICTAFLFFIFAK